MRSLEELVSRRRDPHWKTCAKPNFCALKSVFLQGAYLVTGGWAREYAQLWARDTHTSGWSKPSRCRREEPRFRTEYISAPQPSVNHTGTPFSGRSQIAACISAAIRSFKKTIPFAGFCSRVGRLNCRSDTFWILISKGLLWQPEKNLVLPVPPKPV